MYFHVRLILHELAISLPHEDGFSKVKNDYDDSVYYSVCEEYGVDPTETWMYGDWFYTTDYDVFGHEVRLQKGLHQIILPDGSLHNPKVSQRMILKR